MQNQSETELDRFAAQWQHPRQQPLSWLEEMDIDLEYDEDKRKSWLAYLYAVSLGVLGAHRFYLGHRRRGIWMAALTLVGNLVAIAIPFTLHPGLARNIAAFVASAAAVCLCSRLVTDFLLLPSMVEKYNNELMRILRLLKSCGRTV